MRTRQFTCTTGTSGGFRESLTADEQAHCVSVFGPRHLLPAATAWPMLRPYRWLQYGWFLYLRKNGTPRWVRLLRIVHPIMAITAFSELE